MVLQGMVKVCNKVIIAIGSSTTEASLENPFTADERKDMIQRSLQDVNLIPQFDINFIEIPDFESDDAWAKSCLELAGNVSTLWTGNEETKKCFEGTGVEIQTIKEVPGISSTEVRQMMIDGGNWKDKVPESVVKVMIEIDGVERVKGLK